MGYKHDVLIERYTKVMFKENGHVLPVYIGGGKFKMKGLGTIRTSQFRRLIEEKEENG